jgi:ATP-dependent exoDNAse (exonuclease V) beta subunit
VEAPPLNPGAAVTEPRPPAAPEPPRAPRLPRSFALPAEDESGFPLYRPREQRALRPSEAVLSALDDKREAEADETDELYARLVGTLFHQAMARIAQAGLAAWTDAGTTRRASLAAGLRRLGLPEPQVEAAVTRVLELVAAATAGDHGRRLLDAHPWARAEYALGAWREGRWVAAVIDRCFEDADGVLWLVDYKTTAQRLEPAARQRWMEQAVQRYRPQLALYAELLRAQRPGKALRAALYFPEDDRLAELEGL